MAVTIDAVYEDGVLKPIEPLPLREHQRVRITVQADASWVRRTQGMIRWHGDVMTLERIAVDPALDPQES